LNLPIAGQLGLLLVVVLVVAQVATLLLTLIFPPQPPPQHGLDDIARALRGEAALGGGSRPLIRVTTPAPPVPREPGWLTAEGPRDELAGLLAARPEDVRLMFYVPVSAGAEAGWTRTSSRDPEADPRSADADRPLLILARYEGQAGPPPTGGPGGGFPGGGPGGGFPSGGFPGPSYPSRPQVDPAPRSSAPPPARSPPQAQPSQAQVQPAPAPVVSAPAASAPPSPAPSAAPAGAPPGPGGDGRPAPRDGPGGAPEASRGAPASFEGPRSLPSDLPVYEPPAVVRRRDETIPEPTPRSAPEPGARAVTSAREDAGGQASAPSPTTEAEAGVASPRAATPRSVPLDRTRAAPVRRGLFDTRPPGHVEGDFIAARKIAPDQWVVVRPKPEGFPNAWQTRVMLWFLIALALTAPLGWLFARRITAPLRSFAEAADRLGRDPTAPVLVGDGGAEIGRAARAFNLMQARLRRYVDDRTAMIGAISHDLRTPLARMRFRAERTPDDVRPAFERDIEQMNAMVESVLVFMRDRSEVAVRQRVDLRSVLEVAVDDAVEAGGRVELEPGDQAEAEVDLLGIQRVFANLLDNALKYGDRAVVRLRLEGVEAVVQVMDFGPGLPPEELDRVFRPFYRTSRARAGETQGVGLGLATVRSIVRAHGGDVCLSLDNGLVAEVRLPVAA
jgi:signal transduction histidine kinase